MRSRFSVCCVFLRIKRPPVSRFLHLITGGHFSYACKFFASYFFILQIICVIVPIGQKVHQVLGLNSAITTKPSSIEVSITL